MSAGGSEAMRFDIDGEPAALQLKRIQAELKKIGTEYLKVSKDSTMSADQMKTAQERLIKSFVETEQVQIRLTQTQKTRANQSNFDMQQQQRWNAEMAQMQFHLKNNQQGMLAGIATSNKFGMSIGALSYAVDDFVTVAQLQNWTTDGMIAGMRAASNNVSMLLMAFNPYLAVIPSITTALVALSFKGFGSVEKAAGKTAEKVATVSDKIKQLIKDAANLNLTNQQVADQDKIESMEMTISDAEKERLNTNSQRNQVDAQIEEQKKKAALEEAAMPFNFVNIQANKDQLAAMEEMRAKLIIRGKELDNQIKNGKEAAEKIRTDMKVRQETDTINKQIDPFRDQIVQAAQIALRDPNVNPEALPQELQKRFHLGNSEVGLNIAAGIVDEAQAGIHVEDVQKQGKAILKLPQEVKLEQAQQKLEDFREMREDERNNRAVGVKVKGKARVAQQQGEQALDRQQTQLEREVADAQKELLAAQKEAIVDGKAGLKFMEQIAKGIEKNNELLEKQNQRRAVPGANGNNIPPG